MASAFPLLNPEAALRWLGARRPVPAQLFDPTLKDDAWTVAHTSGVAQVERILNSLRTSLKNGDTIAQWREKLSNTDLTAPHLNTVFRNAVFRAQNAGRYAAFVEDAEDYPWLLYSTAGDEKVRENHAANDGLAMPMWDERWEGRVPALGHNCRCLLTNFTEAQARARATRTDPAPDSLADAEGWGYSPFIGIGKPAAPAAGPKVPKRTPKLRDALPAAARPSQTFMGRALDITTVGDVSPQLGSVQGTLKGRQSALPGDIDAAKALSLLDRQLLEFYTTAAGAGRYRDIRDKILANEVLTAADNTLLVSLRAAVMAAERTYTSVRPVSKPSAAALAGRRGYTNAPYALPAYYTRVVDVQGALSKKFAQARVGDTLHFSGISSFNANGALYLTNDVADLLEIVVVNNARVVSLAPLSKNFAKGVEEEVAMWSARLRVVRLETVPRNPKGNMRRIYVERVDGKEAAVDYDFAAPGGLHSLDLPLGGMQYSGRLSIDDYLDAVLLNCAD